MKLGIIDPVASGKTTLAKKYLKNTMCHFMKKITLYGNALLTGIKKEVLRRGTEFLRGL